MVEEGLRGAKYAADVLGRKAGADARRVHCDPGADEEDESAAAQGVDVSAAQVVRVPPPPPDGWVSGVRVGQLPRDAPR